MWIFTETGFVSAVRHHSEADVIVVRARDWESLQTLANKAGATIDKTPANDYPYRAYVPERAFTQWLNKTVSNLNYTNFKDRVKETRGYHFAGTLMGVWEIMHEVEDDEARAT